MTTRLQAVWLGLLISLFSFQAVHAVETKEWTLLLFLNGHNNLDSYGDKDINELEKVGSTSQMNLVVQWASQKAATTKRLYIQKDADTESITSPVVDDMARVDMGDYKNLVEFVRWGVEHYPAKHYFIDVWDHGSGWRAGTHCQPHGRGISFDDVSGHSITTPQLALAMQDSSKIIGHKVDVYGSDACLMSMVEVAYEMADFVNVSVGSEEVIPAYGWPYDTIFQRLADNISSDAKAVGKIVTEEYTKSYAEGTQGAKRETTFSALDTSKLSALVRELKSFAVDAQGMSAEDVKKMRDAIGSTQSFQGNYFKDIGDFMKNLRGKNLAINASHFDQVSRALTDAVITVKSTKNYEKATGLSIWLPTIFYSTSGDGYDVLKFNADSSWLALLKKLNP